ncbi:dirigent protein 1-like [Salvia hispanica]|uniref:dirigent protein 1-like n=1 Tax=Salvia hispanica TaxID=49212 RepID=UPI00200914DD|nr:dirigent protein 1-like [Salvia hispanica]
MASLNIYEVLIVLYLFGATQINSRKIGDEVDELKLNYLCLKNEKLAKIQFYAQDIVGGPNATIHEVARAAVFTDALLSFGKVFVIDDMITAGPSADTEALGKAQGIMTSADMANAAMAMSYNVVFTSGEYNGSSLSVAGRNEVAKERRRLAVVGGTGVFRFARGYAVFSTYSSAVREDSSLYTVIEFTIYSTFCP